MNHSHQKVPKEIGLDHSLELLKEGYYFIMNRSEKFDSRVVQTRLLGEKTYCLIGQEAAELFYDTDKFFRKEAAPVVAQKTLLGMGGVQGLDGDEHRHRKAMFMSLMTKESLKEIQSIVKEEWTRYLEAHEKEVKVFEAAKLVLARTALRWTGVPSHEHDADDWASKLSPLFEMASKVGPKHLKSRWSRVQLESRLEKLVKQVRNRSLDVERHRAFYHVVWHRDENGELLDPHIVAVEILNLLRPIVAIAVYLDFIFLAINDYPKEAELAKQGYDERHRFIQEVRRYYPFFPFAIARVKKDFMWKGYTFKKNTMTLLDLYGTNHDPELWDEPHQFMPKRFEKWEGNPFDFIPQGGGEFDIGHRCAGEWLTVDIMQVTLDYFLNHVNYELPKQKPDYRMNDIPPIPGMKIYIKH
ncbi:cytochrome P450 [Aquisalibacillus elongatus]|uniref:Fatty-acid peroxygenase n=1 Tax=Aquisalibacillus elongatus TaxID=485577 RepID=A0A3N5AYG8_9BACI|nr:cytochrome P450 [Aquisalibacillus elongatus]RPF50094.1 fatty-acid peroxygenase [Aquisalibacillus elongatus]